MDKIEELLYTINIQDTGAFLTLEELDGEHYVSFNLDDVEPVLVEDDDLEVLKFNIEQELNLLRNGRM